MNLVALCLSSFYIRLDIIEISLPLFQQKENSMLYPNAILHHMNYDRER